MTIKVALLDEQGVFVRMDELESEAELTNLHLPTITSCDLPPGQYRWIPHERNERGGEFENVDWRRRVDETRRLASAEKKVVRRGRVQ